MTRLRAAVVGALTTVLALGTGAVTPAAASMTGIEIGSGDRLQSGHYISVCAGPWEDLPAGQPVVYQVLRSGVWATSHTVTAPADERCVYAAAGQVVPGPGTWQIRGLVRTAPGGTLFQDDSTVRTIGSPASASPEESMLYSLSTTAGRTVPIEVSPSLGQVVDLQRKVGSQWVGVSRTTAPALRINVPKATVRVPVPDRPGLSVYRAVVRPTAWTPQVISSTVTSHQTDVAKHLNLLVTARKHVARFCPKTPIYVGTPFLEGAPGRASWDGNVTDGRGTFTAAIHLSSGVTGRQLKHSALYLCAGVVAKRAWIDGEDTLEETRAYRLYGDFYEVGQAECMAFVIHGSADAMITRSRCTATQQANARRMWLDWGLRYQANPYVWTRS